MKQKKAPADIQKYTDESEQMVLDFFLDLFASQSGYTEEDDVKKEVVCLDAHVSGPDHTYELRLYDRGWKIRRMALGPLGENSGSKSRCYKVIYDDVLVVKIPIYPIRDFDEYIESINAERRIVGVLSPDIECIAPGIAAILRKIPGFEVDPDQTGMALEMSYIRILKKSPWLQSHLKIGESFAFFMSLSRHAFLGNVIQRMHDLPSRLHEEIASQFDILWNLMAFEGMYGPENSSIFFSINEIYNEYEEQVNALLREHRANVSAFAFKRKEWFLFQLAGREIESGNHQNLTPAFFDGLNTLFENLFSVHSRDIEGYRGMMRQYVREKMFKQNRTLFKNIISSVLDLLYWLRVKGVSIRDLKPDNIFVIGDTMLQCGGEFALGLIDFETSLRFRPPAGQTIQQPMLAGTLSYSTPSQFVRNGVLSETLGDLPRLFHIQDWHAAMVMIYFIVTGERLFDRARHNVTHVARLMQQAGEQDEGDHVKTFREISRIFWYHATAEFQEKISRREDYLKSIGLPILQNVKAILKDMVLTGGSGEVRRMSARIDGQSYFISGRSRKDLLNSTAKTIGRCRRNWKEGVNVPDARPEIRKGIIVFLQELEEIKQRVEIWSRMKRLLEQDVPVISIHDLLVLMFNGVISTMYREEWGKLNEDVLTLEKEGIGGRDRRGAYEETVSYEPTVSSALDETLSYEETLSFEKTLTPDDV